jgi:hypothetical protein
MKKTMSNAFHIIDKSKESSSIVYKNWVQMLSHGNVHQMNKYNKNWIISNKLWRI